MERARPKPIDYSEHELAELHLVVSLQGAVANYLPVLPFHTTGVEWDLGADQPDTEQSSREERLKTVYRELSSQISDLMHLLRGPNAP
jgi:hypothetical protein